MSTRWRQHAWDWRWVLCAVRGDRGRKEVLKHPAETNTATQCGLFGCIYHEATRNSTYEATVKCNRIGCVDSVPLPRPSPQSQHSLYHFQSSLTPNVAHQLTPAFLIPNVVYLNKDFYPLPILFVHYTNLNLCLSQTTTMHLQKLAGKKRKEKKAKYSYPFF